MEEEAQVEVWRWRRKRKWRWRLMFLLYRCKRMFYRSWYMFVQGYVLPGLENELVLGLSESIDLCIGCWEVQLAVGVVCMYHISCYPGVRGRDWVIVPFTSGIGHASGNLDLECSFACQN